MHCVLIDMTIRHCKLVYYLFSGLLQAMRLALFEEIFLFSFKKRNVPNFPAHSSPNQQIPYSISINDLKLSTIRETCCVSIGVSKILDFIYSCMKWILGTPQQAKFNSNQFPHDVIISKFLEVILQYLLV